MQAGLVGRVVLRFSHSLTSLLITTASVISSNLAFCLLVVEWFSKFIHNIKTNYKYHIWKRKVFLKKENNLGTLYLASFGALLKTAGTWKPVIDRYVGGVSTSRKSLIFGHFYYYLRPKHGTEPKKLLILLLKN